MTWTQPGENFETDIILIILLNNSFLCMYPTNLVALYSYAPFKALLLSTVNRFIWVYIILLKYVPYVYISYPIH